MGLSELTGLVLMQLLACCFVGIFAIEEDLKPRLVVNDLSALNDVATFSGLGAGETQRKILDIQEAKFVGDDLLLGARNALYVISRRSLLTNNGKIYRNQVVWWFRQNNTNCERKTGSTTTCQNYIRIVAPLSASLIMLCGTNAGLPVCRECPWDGSRIDEKSCKTTRSLALNSRIPYDDLSTLVYKLTDGELFVATRVDFNRLDAAIVRSQVTDINLYQRSSTSMVGANAPSTSLRTKRAFSRWLVDPRFVGMVETGRKILVFFREEAVEAADLNDKPIYSRVAQVCKDDSGGDGNFLNQRWTSFFKARLNCSIPGKRPFYFNEIQSITDAVVVDGIEMVFATFTTPENSISGSAVCAFTLRDVQLAFAGGFLEQNKNSWCWKRTTAGFPHPASCRTSKPTTPQLRFNENHPIMSQSVRSLGNAPLFTMTQSRSRLAAIQVETGVRISSGGNVTVMYMGTDDGKLLKVVAANLTSGFPHPNTTFAEEWLAFDNNSCTRPDTGGSKSANADDPRDRESDDVTRVKKIVLVPNSDVVLVVFRHCVVRLPKQACFLHQCQSSCTNSGNPRCAWVDEACRPVTRDEVVGSEQRVFAATGGECTLDSQQQQSTSSSQQSTSSSLLPAQEDGCLDNSKFALSLVVGLVSTFSFVLLVFLIFVKCRERSKSRRMNVCPTDVCTKEEAPTESDALKKGGFLRGSSRRRKNTEPRVQIEPSSHHSIQNRSSLNLGEALLPGSPDDLRVDGSTPGDDIGGVLVVQNVPHEGSGEDTTWSEDYADSDRCSPLTEFPAAPYMPPGGATVHYNANNNRAVGVAHPISQRHGGKLSQIVRPTFVSSQQQQSDRIRLGSRRDYGAVTQVTSQSSALSPPPQSTRIVTNPNFLPVSPFAPRSATDERPPEENILSPATATFKTFATPDEEDRHSSLESNFPPPPACVLSPTAEVEDLSGRRTSSTTSNRYPSPPQERPPRSIPNLRTPLNRRVSEETHNGRNSSSAMSSSTSGDSSSSGFISSSVLSPQQSFKEKSYYSSSSQKGLIVAKGLLSAQSLAPLKSGKKTKKKKDAKSKAMERYAVAENEPVYENFNPRVLEEGDVLPEVFEEEDDGIPERSPEFEVSSEEEGLCSKPGTPSTTTPIEPKPQKSKKSLGLFKGRRSKKGKKDRMQGTRITDEDTFISPAYDEEPFVPTVEGWEEIEYRSPTEIHDRRDDVNSMMTSFDAPRSFDDSYVEMRGGGARGGAGAGGQGHDFAFYTMRPKGRMRQKMPKMRNTDKEWALTNNPLPVPTPAVPHFT